MTCRFLRLPAIVASILGVLLSGCAAPRAATPAGGPRWDADRAEILSLIDSSAARWNAADLKWHLAIYVDTVTFMTTNGPRPGVAPVEEAFTRAYWRGGRPIQELGFEQVTIRPLDRDAALATGRFRLTGGGEAEQSGWFTLVWIRTAAGWRAVHDHSS